MTATPTDVPPATAAAERLAVEYVLPLKWSHDDELPELVAYLTRLVASVDVTVVDGSPAPLADQHRQVWPTGVRTMAPEPWAGRNGKVGGVVTGVRAARHPRVVIADDDVRWTAEGLRRVTGLLAGADLVRPQNYFVPRPWHARWDTGRSLLNRALGADYPGTYALRRDTFLRMGGYDGDALFENLELSRTVRAAGGRERRAADLYVVRRPPATGHFLRQRVRQAYDDLAQPLRLTVEAAVLPGSVALGSLAGRRSGPRGVLLAAGAAAAAVAALAEVGRRRHGGRAVFPPGAALWAPLWLAERAVCVWAALFCRLRGGVRYGDGRVRLAAHQVPTLRRRLRSGAVPALRPLPSEEG